MHQSDLEDFTSPPLTVSGRLGGLVTRDGASLSVPPMQFKILAALNANYPAHLTEDRLRAQVYGERHIRPATLRGHIAKLRVRLRDERFPAFIVAKWGYGYRLELEAGK